MLKRIIAAGAIAFGVLVVAQPAVASAAPVTIPFQVNPAPFGNPNGSIDLPGFRCVAEVGRTRGEVTITGGKRDRWGCIPYANVHWVNLSNGKAGVANLGAALNGQVPHAVLRTGSGQVALTLLAGGVITPGFATFVVP